MLPSNAQRIRTKQPNGHTQADTRVLRHTHMHTRTHAYAHTHARTHTCIRTHAHTHRHTRTHTHIVYREPLAHAVRRGAARRLRMPRVGCDVVMERT